VTEGAGSLDLRLSRDGHVWQGDSFVPLRMEKVIELASGSTDLKVKYRLVNPGSGALNLRFGVETNWAMLGGNGPYAHYAIPGRDNLPLNGLHESGEVSELHLVLEWMGMDIGLTSSVPATLWCFPLETISNSEAGFERVYQGSSVTFVWGVGIWVGGLSVGRGNAFPPGCVDGAIPLPDVRFMFLKALREECVAPRIWVGGLLVGRGKAFPPGCVDGVMPVPDARSMFLEVLREECVAPTFGDGIVYGERRNRWHFSISWQGG